jgi:porphobilinogen synthase
MLQRPRRNRKSAVIRDMVQETYLSPANLIFPLFIVDGRGQKVEVSSKPGIYRYSVDNLLREIESCLKLGLRAFDLFPAVEESLKDKYATESYREGTLYLRAIEAVKKNFPEACVVTDVAMDPYSSDGHDGIVVVGEILDDNGFSNVSLMSYTAKYASAFYGPFRDALGSAPKKGDKKSYQMNPANQKEALIEAQLDLEEGADFLMVKPGLPYLDVIKLLYDNFDLPIAAYNVSGEYAMLKAAIANGWLSEQVIMETLLSFRRAGATSILTYHAKEVLENGWLK